MPWHKVVIIHDDQARWSAAALMRPFIMGSHEHGSTPPENAFVYHGFSLPDTFTSHFEMNT